MSFEPQRVEIEPTDQDPSPASWPSPTNGNIKTSQHDCKPEADSPIVPWPQTPSPLLQVPVVSATLLTFPGALKRTYAVELDLSQTALDYMPGDAFGILCPNRKEEVQWLGHWADIDLFQPVLLSCPETHADYGDLDGKVVEPFDLLLHRCDLRFFPSKAILRKLIQCIVPDEREASNRNGLYYLSDRHGAEAYRTLVGRNFTTLDILFSFDCKPALAQLLDTLPAIKPRYYSFASSMLKDGEFKRASFVFNVVEKELDGEHVDKKNIRVGLCSTHLEELIDGKALVQGIKTPVKSAKINLFRRPPSAFRIAEDPKTPIVMIAAGTGIAPFIGFLEHRSAQKASGIETGPMWLYFGCRHRQHDLILRADIDAFKAEGVLTGVYLAASREPEASLPHYVQDAVGQRSRDIYTRMTTKESPDQPLARIYICGDEVSMVKGVNETLISMCEEHGRATKAEAKSLLSQWTLEKRVCYDIWT